LAVAPKIDPHRREHTFEIFGYDFMLDEDFKIYLIEANTNPCLETSCPLLARIISELLDNSFRLTVDPMFQNEGPTSDTSLPLLKYELVFDSKVDKPEYLKTPIDGRPIIELEEENDIVDES